MKFTKSLIATSVLAAAATASAKTTMTIDGEAFYQTSTLKSENDAFAISNIDGDVDTASGLKVEGTFLSFDSEWEGFNTYVELMPVAGMGVGVSQLNVTTSHMGGKLDVKFGLQSDMIGGMHDFGILYANSDGDFTEAISATYKLAQGNVSLLLGNTPDAYYYGQFANAGGVVIADDEGNPVPYNMEEADTAKWMAAGPFMGLVYDATYGALDVLASYHSRTVPEYKTTVVELESASQTWMALGLGYTMGKTVAGFDYTTETQGATVEGDDDTVITGMLLKVSHDLGMVVPTFSYMTSNKVTGDADTATTMMELDVTYNAGKDYDWFFAYQTSTVDQLTDGAGNDVEDDALTTTSMMLGATFSASQAM